MTKEQRIAKDIVDQMSQDDKASYTSSDWREGVSMMLQGDWAGADEDAIHQAIAELLENK